MKHSNTIIYLTCARHKSLQKKHIDICRRCQWNVTCEPYQKYCDSETRTENKEPPTTVTPRHIPEALLNYIRKELEAIIMLLENQSPVDREAPPLLKMDPLFQHDVLEDIKKELRKIKTIY